MRYWKNFLSKNKEGLAALLLFVIAAFLFGGGRVRAAEEPGNCDLNQESISLSDLEKGDLDYIDKSRAELKIRKEILSKIVNCGLEEVGDLMAKINEIGFSEDKDIQIIKDKIIRELSDAKNYYQIQKGGVSDLDLTGSRNLAKRILEWRQGNYNLLSKKVLGFLALARNQELVILADRRISQADKLIIAFKLYDNKELVKLSADSLLYFGSAKENSSKAKQNFISAYYQPEESIALIKDSLESLAVVYKNLFDFNKAFKELLPKL